MHAANLRELVPHIALVQLGDRKVPHSVDQQRCRLGEGVVPLRKTIAGLREAGYNGDFDIELAGAGFEASGYHGLLSDCRRSFEAMTPAMSKSMT